MKTKTPELDKIQKYHKDSQKIGVFLDWLGCQGFIIAEYCGEEDERMVPVRLGTEKLLAMYFGVDLDKAEQERQALLDEARKEA